MNGPESSDGLGGSHVTEAGSTRLRRAAPFLGVAGAAAVAGGVLAAATAFAPSYLASWVTAYLVLVVGVAQGVLGVGRSFVPAEPPSAREVLGEVVGYGLANVAVVAGVVLERETVTFAGAVLLLLVLLRLLRLGWTSPRRGWLRSVFLGMLLVLIASVPVGTWITATSRS